MPVSYIGKDGQWLRVKEAYVGQNGEWKKERIRLVGSDGKWVEARNSEPVPDSEFFGIHGISYRAGGHFQGALEISGYGLSDIVPPSPDVGAFYTFRATLSDHFDNFPGLQLFGDELPLPTIEDGNAAYAFDSSKKQYSSPPSDGTGYDLLGLIGGDANTVEEPRGKKHWELGGKIKPSVWPSEGQFCFLYYSGSPTQNISVWYDSTGSIFARFKNGDYVKNLHISDAVELNQWTGFVFRHRPTGTTRYLELELHDGRIDSLEGDIPRSVDGETYNEFGYWVPEEFTQIKIGSGTQPGGQVPAEKFFEAANTSSLFTISPDGLELTGTSTQYMNSVPSDFMNPGTGRYYVEIANRDSWDMQIGVTDLPVNLEMPPGVLGWCINTISGRKFAKQTGGGTNWTSKLLPNSTIGLVYDSDQGLIEIYVNGVKRADPFPSGTITSPVKFIIGGRAETAILNIFNPRVELDPGLWAFEPSGPLVPVPHSLIDSPGGLTWTSGVYRDWYIRNEPMTNARTLAVLDPSLKLEILFTDLTSGQIHVVNRDVLKTEVSGNLVTTAVPELPYGNYEISFRYPGHGVSNGKLFTITEFVPRSEPLSVDFGASSLDHIRRELMASHKQWGGINGGVSADNILLNLETGTAELTACGNDYRGSVKGVDRFGKPSGFNTRIGACLVTRDYYGPGSYRCLMKPLQVEGACNAVWSFHYEEGYPGTELFDRHIADGMHIQGNEEDGFYTVRNHEIDIEFPTALKTDLDQEDVNFHSARLNTWVGEVRNWNVPNNDVPVGDPNYSPDNDPEYWSEYTDNFEDLGINLADGQYHEFRYDWHLGDDPRVEFYFDGVLKHVIRTHIPDIPGRYWAGMWFPSGNTQWAGRNADWETQTMHIRKIEILPFADEQQYCRNVVETYPSDVFRDFKNVKNVKYEQPPTDNPQGTSMETFFEARVTDDAVTCRVVEDGIEIYSVALDPYQQVPQFHELAVDFVRAHRELDLVDIYEPDLYRIEIYTDGIPPTAILDTTAAPLLDTADLYLES